MAYPAGPPPGLGPSRPSSTARVVGILLILPAFLLLLGQLLVPSLQTLWLAVFGSASDGRFGGPTGLQALEILGRELPSSLLSGFARVLAPWLLSAVLGAGLALTACGPRSLALAGRIITGLLVALYAPVVVGVSMLRSGPRLGPDGVSWFLAAVIFFPVLTGLHAVVVAAVLRRRGRVGRTLAVVGGISAVSAVAVGLQQFVAPYLSGGLLNDRSAAMAAYFYAFARHELTVGAMVATLVLLVCGMLGIGAVALLVETRTRVILTAPGVTAPTSTGPDLRGPDLGGPTPASWEAPNPGATGLGSAGLGPTGLGSIGSESTGLGVAGLAVGLVALVAAGATFGPYLAAQGTELPASEQALVPRALLQMWGPSFLVATGQFIVAAAAAIGIGWFRPFGPNSRRVLLVFAPWLLVAPVTLSLARYDTLRTLGLLDTPFAALPATLVAVPALVVVTLMIDGLREQRDAGLATQTAAGPWGGVGALILGALWISTANELAWPIIMTADPNRQPGQVIVLRAVTGAFPAVPYSAALPVVLLLILLAGSAVLQALVFRRVTLSSR